MGKNLAFRCSNAVYASVQSSQRYMIGTYIADLTASKQICSENSLTSACCSMDRDSLFTFQFRVSGLLLDLKLWLKLWRAKHSILLYLLSQLNVITLCPIVLQMRHCVGHAFKLYSVKVVLERCLCALRWKEVMCSSDNVGTYFLPFGGRTKRRDI